MKRYYLLALANFLAAIGGGAILSSGFDSFKGWFPKWPIVAFLIGIVVGLLFQLLVSEQWSRSIAPWFSVAVGPTSLVLAGIIKVYNENETLHGAAAFFFFALLSFRYGLWFFSRALRSQAAGSKRQGIALIELGYFSGMVFGLVVQQSVKYGMLSALLVDAMLQTIAGAIDHTSAVGRHATENAPADLRATEESPHAPVVDGRDETVGKIPFDYSWYWKLTTAVVCLNIGFQAVAFSINHTEKGLNTYVLAYFYSGVALAALCCRAFQIKFDWSALDFRVIGNATINSELMLIKRKLKRKPKTEREPKIKRKPNFGLITLMAAASMLVAVWGSEPGTNAVRLELPFIAAAAFIYQILLLSLLDHIGRAEKLSGLNKMIKLTYLILGVGTVLSILVLDLPTNNHTALMIVTVACSLISFYVVRRRADARV